MRDILFPSRWGPLDVDCKPMITELNLENLTDLWRKCLNKENHKVNVKGVKYTYWYNRKDNIINHNVGGIVKETYFILGKGSRNNGFEYKF